MILNEISVDKEEQKTVNTDKYFLIGISTDNDATIDPDELLRVQEIECPVEYQQDLFRMISCQVLLEQKIKEIDGLVLRCSMCKKSFAYIDELIEHKKLYKICKNNLSKMNVSFKRIIRRKRYEDIERHQFLKSQLNSFYY